MGKRDRNRRLKEIINFDDSCSESDEENNFRFKPIENEDDVDDEEANEDFSLKIVQKALQRKKGNEVVADLKTSENKKEKKKRKKKNKSAETQVAEETVSGEMDDGFKDFCGELFLVDNGKGEENMQTDEAVEISDNAVEMKTPEVSDNVVLKKLLRGPRYFDPPDNNSWGACYNCGEEGHTTANCTSARRKKPCFVCGSLEHNAKQCSKGRDCYICKQQGHRSKDCPEKNSSKMCLKCGDFGHDMFQCRNDYSPDDLKEIQCYVCHKIGHLCCVDYGSPSKKLVSCYKCGGSGHTGLACTRYYHGDTNGSGTPNSCYRCGEAGHFARECTNSVIKGDANSSCYKCGGEGHFARECTNSVTKGDANSSCYKCGGEGHFARECTTSKKPAKRYREQSTPNQRSSKKNRDIEASSASQDFGKMRKKNKSQNGDFSTSLKAKHRGGWIADDTDYYDNSTPRSHNNRSPSTPSDRRYKTPNFNSDYASSSRSSRNYHKSSYSNYPSAYRSNGYNDHRYSASHYGNNSTGGW